MQQIHPHLPISLARKWKLWRAKCDDAAQKLRESFAVGDPLKIDRKLYGRSSICKAYFFSTDAPFYGKCVYCETNISEGSREVEHFRPKAAVTDAKGKTITITDESGNDMKHPGYYWLAYEWTNLIPACKACNVRKLARFPVANNVYVSSPDGDLATEAPLLINPASGNPEDDPEKHLKIDTTSGRLEPLSDRGRTCIDLFCLNTRDRLPDSRGKTCQLVWAWIRELGDRDKARRQEAVAKIKRAVTGRDPNVHAIADRAVFREWQQTTKALEDSHA